MPQSKIVYLGIKGSVITFDRASGRRLWVTPLKGGDFVTVLVDGDRVFAGAWGEIFCLDAANGNLLWHDPLKGFGRGLVSIATENASSHPAAAEIQEIRQRQAAAAAAASSCAAAC
jgi:outer membrane protein assembly factor BamB